MEIDTILLGVIALVLLSFLVLLGYTKYIEIKKLRVSSERIQRNTNNLFEFDFQQKMYKAAFKGAEHSVLILDSYGTILDCNDNFDKKILSHSRVLNKHIHEFIPTFFEQVEEGLGKKFKTKMIVKGENIKVTIKINIIKCFKIDGSMVEGYEVTLF